MTFMPTNDGGGYGLDPTTLALFGLASGLLGTPRNAGFGPALGAGIQGAMSGLMLGQSSMDRRRRMQEDERARATQEELAREKLGMAKDAAARKAAMGDSIVAMLGDDAPGFNVQTQTPTQLGPDLQGAGTVIGGIESGGRYDIVGKPATPQGNRAYGKYQVMDFNVGPWTKEILGQEMTPEQFLASPQAQDAVFKGKFGQYVKQYGSQEAAARAWFAGPGGMNNPDAKDVLGTSVAAYSRKFNNGQGGTQVAQAGGGGVIPQGDSVSPDSIKSLDPRVRAAIAAVAKVDPDKAAQMMVTALQNQKKEDSFYPLTEDDAKMFLGKAYDGTKAYQRNRVTGKIEQIGGAGTTVNIDNKQQGEFSKEMGKLDAKRFGEIITAEGTLNDMASKIGFALDQLRQTYTGPAGETANTFFKILGSLGIDAAKDKANAADAGMAVISQMKPYMRAAGSGASSDKDMDMFARALPSLLNMPGGNERIGAYFQRLADRATQIRQLAQEHSEGGRIPLTGTKFDDAVKALGPLFNEEERKELMGLGKTATRHAPALVELRPMSDFDVQGARKAGYSDAEIADHLASLRGFDVGAARAAGYKDKEIVDHLSPPASLGRRALDTAVDAADTAFTGLNTGVNYLGTQAVKAAGGLAGIPKAVGEGMDWVSRKTGAPVAMFGPPSLMAYMKDRLPTGDDVSKAFFDATGAPEVKLEGNIPGGKIIDSAVQGAMTAPFSWPMAISGAFGGAGQEIAGQLTEGTPYETPARVAGGLVGGVGGAMTAAAGSKAGKIVSSLKKPLTTAGRDDVVGDALSRSASNPKTAAANIDKYVIAREAFPDSAPGFKIDAGKASRDPGLMAVADTVPDRIRGFNVQNNNARLTDALDKAATGLPSVDDAGGAVQKILADRFKALQEARSTAATPLYEAARNFPEDLPVGRLFKYVDETIAANKGEPKAVMESARKLLFNAKGEPDFSARGLMAAREGLGALFTPTLDKHSRELLVGLRNRIDETMQTVPEAKAARATFAEKSVPLEPFGKKTQAAKIVETDPITKKFVLPEGKVVGDLKPTEVNNIIMASGGDATVKANLAALYIDDFKNSVGNAVQRDQTGRPMLGAYPAAKWMEKHRGAARNVLTDDQIRALDDIAKHLEDQAQTVPGRSGSPTFDRLGTQSILAAVISPRYADAPWLHGIRKGLGLVYGGADEAIMNRLYEVIQDPALTKALMKKATEGNAKLAEPLLQKLAKGGAVGTITSDERGSR